MNDFTDDLHGERADDGLHDPDLAAALGALSPAVPDDGRYADLTPRFVRARHRRRIAMAATGLTAVAALTLGAVVINRADETLTGVRTSPAGRGGTEPRPGVGDGPDRAGRGTSTTTIAAPEESTPTPPATEPSGGTAAPTATSSSSTPGPPVEPRQQTFSSEGGSITVLIGDRSVTLQATYPEEDFVADVRAAGPAEVEVRFREPGTGESEHRIRLRFDAAGRLLTEIT